MQQYISLCRVIKSMQSYKRKILKSENLMRLQSLCFLSFCAFSLHVLHADSILFLPDSNAKRPAHNEELDSFGGSAKDSDLRIFDIQKRGFDSKDSKGFRELPEESKTQEIKPPTDMKQEELPKDYSHAFQTSYTSNTHKAQVVLAAHTQSTTKQTKQVANGATFIAISNEKKPEKLHREKKVIPWLAHPTDSGKKIAFVPIPYKQKIGNLQLSPSMHIEVVEGNYKKEKITITDTSKTKPNKAANERIAKEFAEANAMYRTYTPTRYWNAPFMLPMQSVITSPFGSARVFNNEIKSFHGGTDFRAKIGTQIHASNDGVVVIAKDRFLAGKSVVLDHGEGIFSMYYHCSEIKVKVGQKVKKGQVVAFSGDTGRVSGAHLHFGILVQGVQVDPIDFIEKVNALF